MKKNTVLSFLALLPLFAFAPYADGALTCTFNSVTGVNFGPYDVFATVDNVAQGSVVYQCKKVGGPQLMVMSFSAGHSGNFMDRTFFVGTPDLLHYNLYFDSNHTQIWGDTAGYQYTIDPVDQKIYTLTVWGRIPAKQDVGVGSYKDTITVTMNF